MDKPMNDGARNDGIKVAPVCDVCGSYDVHVDAWSEWDVDNQQWALKRALDAAYCASCDEAGASPSVDIDWVEIRTRKIGNTNYLLQY